LFLRNTASFFAEKLPKSQKTVSITLSPGKLTKNYGSKNGFARVSRKKLLNPKDGSCGQGCQIFLDTIDQNRRKLHYNITKWPENIPKGRKIFHVTIKYTNLFHSEALRHLPKFGF
jgi:hypothetical protein